MTIVNAWTSPAAGGALDRANGQLIYETEWDAAISNMLYSGGVDGNTKNGPLTIGGTFKANKLTLSNNCLEEWATDADTVIGINYLGYNGGTTRFRDTNFYDGKTGLVATIGGQYKSLSGALAPRFWAGPGAWKITGTPPAFAQSVAGNEHDYWEFADAVNQYLALALRFPSNFAGGTVRVYVVWYAPSGSGNVVWTLGGVQIAVGASPVSSWASQNTVTTAAANAITITSLAWSGWAATSQGNFLNLYIQRQGTDGSDTLAAGARMLGAMIELGS